MGILSSVMAGAQKGLAVAEHRHAKVVKVVRQEATAFLQNEAEVYGKFLSGYSAELAQAEDEVKDAARLAQAAIAKEDAKPSNPADWKPNDPALKLRTKLASQANFAQQAITRAEHKNMRQVKEAEEHIEETLEDSTSKLAYKVGDMTPEVDKVKQTLEAVVEKKVPTLAASKPTAATSNLTVLQDNLAKATLKSPAKIAAANKKLQEFLVKTDKDVALEGTKLQKSLDEDSAKPIEIKVKSAPAKAKVVAKPAPTIKKVDQAKVKAAAPSVAHLQVVNSTQHESMKFGASADMRVDLGPFATAADACDYCFGSFTKEGDKPAGPVAPFCVCMAYPTGGKHNMFCATPPSAAGYIAEKKGCRCKAKDMEAMGKTTCAPI